MKPIKKNLRILGGGATAPPAPLNWRHWEKQESNPSIGSPMDRICEIIQGECYYI